ncbi:AMP-binding protein [Streptomyces sp. NPDC126514]|uniref:AMP-binding protein n=1 Tax=Streptomyces sp. NPDC126514 TaxID=3155210 RepID=UPI00332E6E87
MTGTPISLWGGPADPDCFLNTLAAVAAEHPEATAVADETHEISYARLLEWAATIAGMLAASGIQAEDPVAVTGPRGAHPVAAMLATAMLGAAYVPLDPQYPAKRLRHMVTDSGAKLLLYCGSPPDIDAAVPYMAIPEPDTQTALAQDTQLLPPSPCRPDLPVYVIYTSGSTGWPKGVGVTHLCLDAMVDWQAHHSPRGDLRTAQFAPLNFDVWFQEVLGTLCGAGTVVIVPERLRREAGELLTWLADRHIERLFLPYVALQMLAVAAPGHPDLERLRLKEVNTAGEQMVCTPQIRALFTGLPDCRLVNHYGQSESAMVTSHILTGTPDQWPDVPPIGVPLPGCEVLVAPESPRDPALGELIVAGAPVSPGYLRRPELTAQRFVRTDPTPQGHTRVFRTGDLVRITDGVVHFITRVDADVKIRGIRVNLLEVDAQLLHHPAIDAAATVAVEQQPARRILRAAVVLAPHVTALDSTAVLDALHETLPPVSIPLSLTVLPCLPRTPSGKTDRSAVAALIARDLADGRVAAARARATTDKEAGSG